MAKSKATPTTKTTDTTAAEKTTQADSVRDYRKRNPEAGPKKIADALCADGVEITAARVSAVLRQDGASNGKVTVDQIKLAASVLKTAGSVDAALESIEAAGAVVDLLKACRSPEKAKEALKQADVFIGELAS